MFTATDIAYYHNVGRWPCPTCLCQSETCSESCVKHQRVNRKEWFE